MEIQLTLTKEELDCLTNALERRLENVNLRLTEKGGSPEFYGYFKDDRRHLLEILNKIDAAQ